MPTIALEKKRPVAQPLLWSRLCSALSAVLLVNLPLPQAHAEQQEQEETEQRKAVEKMEEVVVYGGILKEEGLDLEKPNSAANRLGLTALEFAGSTETISREEISNKGDYSPLQAVTRATGFASSATPGNGGTSTAVRGFNGHGSIVNLYDGTRLYVGAGTATFPADTWTILILCSGGCGIG